MSFFPCPDPVLGDKTSVDSIETLVIPRTSDIGGLEVRRALPTVRRRLVGPFIFFDRMGPAVLRDGDALDVRPHPHIGLSTVTYLFDGHIRHRDSLGTEMVIRPGDVNLMTAGRGIVHSERSPEEERNGPLSISGIQTWLALPDALEEISPEFFSHQCARPAGDGGSRLLRSADHGIDAWGEISGDPACGYALCRYSHKTKRALPDRSGGRRARHLYPAGQCRHRRRSVSAGSLAGVSSRRRYCRAGRTGRRAYHAFGGATLGSKRYVWWNFVSSSRERIEQAKEEWRSGRFDIVPGDEQDFIPLPE